MKNRILKMEKIVILLSFLFAFWGTNSAKTDSLLIRYSDLNRETINISTCSNFEWRNGYEREIVVSSQNHVDTLKALLDHLQEIEDEYFPVRCKMYIFDSDTIKQKICLNKTSIAFNGKVYANNDSIINYINHLMLDYPSSDTRRFFPDIIGADYVEGKDSLYNLLLKEIDILASSAKYKGSLILGIKCEADKNGKTRNAEVSIIRPQKHTKKELEITNNLRDYIIRNIFWRREINRGIHDIIYFTIRYR